MELHTAKKKKMQKKNIFTDRRTNLTKKLANYTIGSSHFKINSNFTSTWLGAAGMMSIDSGGNYTNYSSLLSNPTLYSGKSRTNPVNSLSSRGTLATATTTVTMATSSRTTMLLLPFHYQQAISQRCTLIARKLQQFFKLHLIDTFGSDFAASGLARQPFLDKVGAFFAKRRPTGEPYDTYLLCYCGPTSANEHISLVDGSELSIQEIVSLWKEINCGNKVYTRLLRENCFRACYF